LYRKINDALNEVFLGGRFDSRPLYLVLDQRGREELTKVLSGVLGAGDIADQCSQHVGAHLRKFGDPYASVLDDMFAWRANGRKSFPPCTATLFTLARAAELMVSDGKFSSSNYYQRLSSLTGISSSNLSSNGPSTEKMWRSFNNWLADTDFAHGRPTARAVNSYRYVGIAMSQAIVREEDRQRFHDLFEKYRFRSSEAVTQEEILQYIGTWIHGAKPTKQLKAAWAKPDLRPRICEAAIATLADWAEETAGTRIRGSTTKTALSIAASFRRDLLSRSIVLYLGRETELELVEIPPLLETAPRTIGNTSFGTLATVEPRSSLNWPEILIHGLQLLDTSGSEYAWSGRAVIPLNRSEHGDYWTEVGRVTLGTKYVVLARSEKRVRDGVEAALEQVARPGYTLSTDKELRGLPSGWVIYENVEIIRQLDRPGMFQEPLSAVGQVGGLRVTGGLKIARSIWHQRRPPLIVLTGSEGPMSLVAYEGTSSEEKETSSSNEVSLEIAGCIPDGGNLHVEGRINDKVAETTTLLFRSAGRPRPIDRQLAGVIAYSGPWETASANTCENIRGLLGSATVPPPPIVNLSDFMFLGDHGGEIEDGRIGEDEQVLTARSTVIAGLSLEEVLKLPCEVRGLHVFKYETLKPDFPKYLPVNKECTGCGLHALERRGTPSQKPATLQVPTRKVPPTERSEKAERPEQDIDIWFDAACFLGKGSTATFESLVAAENVDPWHATTLLRDMSWLGLIDLEYKEGMRPRAWSVAPPALAFCEERRGFLAGFRDPALLDALVSAITSRGGRVIRRELHGRPELIVVEAISIEQARDALSGTRDAHGRQLEVVEIPGLQLARFCVSRGDILSAFRPMTLAHSGEFERFDLSRHRWRRVVTTHEQGAYRFSYAGTQYAFRATSGQAYSTSHEMAKLAAARLAKVRLHAYDEEARVFSSVLGCEPPALLGRALVACSGYLPFIDDGISMFTDVPPEVASLVLSFLYNGDLPS
jgi:hypothetical protein